MRNSGSELAVNSLSGFILTFAL